NVMPAGTIGVSGGAAINLLSDNLAIDPQGIINASSGTITISPLTANRPINLGTKTAGQLGLTNTELGRITSDTLNIGDSNTVPITIRAAISQPVNTMALVTGVGVSGAGAITNGTGSSALLTIDQAGNSSYGGAIGGPSGDMASAQNLAFTKLGPGALTLAGF